MTRSEFDFIIKTVSEKTHTSCPETFQVLLWGKFKHWDSLDFAKLIKRDINNHKRAMKHVNS